MNRRDDGLRAVLDIPEAGVERLRSEERLLACYERPKNADVGARHEHRSRADEHDRANRLVGDCSSDRDLDPVEDTGAESGDWRVVEGDETTPSRNAQSVSSAITRCLRDWH